MKRPKVIAKIVGGIGNQIFCYAAARRLAIKNEASLCLDLNFFQSDVNYGRAYRLDSFTLPLHETIETRRLLPASLDLRLWRLTRIAGSLGALPGKDWLIEAVPGVFEPRILEKRVTRTTVLDGYWQDERYFRDIETPLRADLTFRPEIRQGAGELAALIEAGASVAVHGRRYGAPGSRTGGANAVLGADFYRRAVQTILARVPQAKFYLFGDDPGWVVEQLPKGLDFTVVHNSGLRGDATDLYLMSRCRHFIVANSTFSWWGAWLGAHPEKIVVASRPKGLQYEVRSAPGWIEIDWQ